MGKRAVALEANGAVKRFGPVTAVEGLDLRVAAGEVFGLLGPNGAGKTTTVRMLAALLAPNAGQVAVFFGQALGYWYTGDRFVLLMLVVLGGANLVLLALAKRMFVRQRLAESS